MNDTSVHTILAAISEAKMALDREPEYKARIAELETKLEPVLKVMLNSLSFTQLTVPIQLAPFMKSVVPWRWNVMTQAFATWSLKTRLLVTRSWSTTSQAISKAYAMISNAISKR